MSPEGARSGPETRFPIGSIVVGVDGSASSVEAVEWAARQAARDRRPMGLLHTFRIDGVYWIPTMGYDPRDIRRAMLEEGERLVWAAQRRVREVAHDVEVHLVVADADAGAALVDASRTASMVVLGSRGRGPLASRLLGSVGVTLVRHACCPVVIRPAEPDHDGLTEVLPVPA